MSKRHLPNAPSAAQRLLSLIERVERLEDEKREIAEQIGDVKREAKSAGFDLKAFNQMLKERRMAKAEREEFESLCELYRASLGMLDGTPLGDAARRRMMGLPPEDNQAPAPPPAPPPEPPRCPSGETWDEIDDEAAAEAPPPEPPPPEPEPPVDPLIAREEGEEAARAGKTILDNPYPPMDPRRARWDEGFCFASGSDGMDIPAHWRRAPKKKKSADDNSEDKGGEP